MTDPSGFVDRGVLASWREVLAWLCRRRLRVRVSGASMEPTLRAGDHVLVARRPLGDLDDLDDLTGVIVVADHPHRSGLLVIKRVVGSPSADLVELGSDNLAAGSDSRQWGPVPTRSVIGPVTHVFGRRRSIRSDRC